MSDERRAFYDYHCSTHGAVGWPCAVAFTDGRQIGAMLDRNASPARYIVTEDDFVILASEAGSCRSMKKRSSGSWRLQPGRMLLIDMGRRPHHLR
ncbi:glutamate synthase, large subunit [Brucella neotomae]|uniref:hypothetical protein n=1 Tax=Brucella neotomae TaxID=29460 RepID=UPI000D95CBEA|nr:hypothetical protein [Brucella neotomae]SPU66809.1 glutamate synthase, large subunit [Brucella neotomae]